MFSGKSYTGFPTTVGSLSSCLNEQGVSFTSNDIYFCDIGMAIWNRLGHCDTGVKFNDAMLLRDNCRFGGIFFIVFCPCERQTTALELTRSITTLFSCTGVSVKVRQENSFRNLNAFYSQNFLIFLPEWIDTVGDTRPNVSPNHSLKSARLRPNVQHIFFFGVPIWHVEQQTPYCSSTLIIFVILKRVLQGSQITTPLITHLAIFDRSKAKPNYA